MPLSRLQIWTLAARPKTLAAAIGPVLIGTAMAHADVGFHLLSALAALIGALLIQVGTNFANDYADFKKGTDTEERLGPLRVTQAGLVAPSTMRNAAFLVFGVAVLIGIYLVWRGGWPIVTIGLLSILFGVLYTAGPYPLGYHGWGDIFVLIFFGPVAVAGTYYVQTLTITVPVIAAGIAPGLFSVAILSVNNLRDIDNDRSAGKKTLAVRFGWRFAIAEYTACLLIACSLPVVITLVYNGRPWIALSCLTMILAIPAIKSICITTGRALNDLLASTGRLLLLYSILFSIGWLL